MIDEYRHEEKLLARNRRGFDELLTDDDRRLRDLYGQCWAVKTITRSDGIHTCYCCEQPASGRSSMNIWGTIVDFETCDSCNASNDLKWADSVPNKVPTNV